MTFAMAYRKKPSSFLAVLLVGACCQFTYGSECNGYTGKPRALSASEMLLLKKAVDSIRKKDLSRLKENSTQRLLFIRNFISGETNARGGNFWYRLKWNQIDKNMTVHLFGQDISDFSDSTIFSAVSIHKGLSVDRGVCATASSCDLLPKGDELPDLIGSLMECNAGSGRTVYVFSDGILLTDMQLITGLPIGEGLFFSKGPNGYKLSALIDLQ